MLMKWMIPAALAAGMWGWTTGCAVVEKRGGVLEIPAADGAKAIIKVRGVT